MHNTKQVISIKWMYIVFPSADAHLYYSNNTSLEIFMSLYNQSIKWELATVIFGNL